MLPATEVRGIQHYRSYRAFLLGAHLSLVVFEEKYRTHLDLLSIPQSGGRNVKTFRSAQRLQIQNLFMAFKRVPLWWYRWVNSIISGRSPPLYCTLTLIAMQGHHKNSETKHHQTLKEDETNTALKKDKNRGSR